MVAGNAGPRAGHRRDRSGAGWSAPTGDLRKALAAVHEGHAQGIGGTFPGEIQPLVDDFNEVLAYNARILSHARTQAET